MIIDVSSTDVVTVYRAIVGVVTPRPIAWVTTVDGQGCVNLAPFSFFNAFGANPPVVVFSPTLRRDGTKKDTLLNLEAVGEFVVNSAVEALAEKMNATSKELPPGQSEADFAGLELRPSSKVRPPRVAQAPVHLECRVRQIIPIGDGPIAANLVIGEVLLMHVADSVLDPSGSVDPKKLRTIARLGSDYYCRSTDLFEMVRPYSQSSKCRTGEQRRCRCVAGSFCCPWQCVGWLGRTVRPITRLKKSGPFHPRESRLPTAIEGRFRLASTHWARRLMLCGMRSRQSKTCWP
jgi:flavin reductase (DIM6/NTAB) family NADH-FMN oxidoreductase RutF